MGGTESGISTCDKKSISSRVTQRDKNPWKTAVEGKDFCHADATKKEFCHVSRITGRDRKIAQD
jgi:hypothetical protein